MVLPLDNPFLDTLFLRSVIGMIEPPQVFKKNGPILNRAVF